MTWCAQLAIFMLVANVCLVFFGWLKATRLAHLKRESWKSAMRRAGYSEADIEDWEREQ